MSLPYVGILLNDSIYRGIPRGKTSHEHLPFYDEAGKKFGMIPCFFRLRDIESGQDDLIAYVRNEQGIYKKTKMPPPKVIHNRAIYFTMDEKRKMKQLVSDGRIIFNFWNDCGKMKPHRILMKEADLLPHLPETVMASETQIQEMVDKHHCLIVKPYSGSLGKGIYKIEKVDSGKAAVSQQLKNRTWEKILPIDEMLPRLVDMISTRRYIVQQRIPLATYHGSPFDLRVSVQRNETGEWQVTGIVAKVAHDGRFLTNVAQGGKVYPFAAIMHSLPQLNKEDVYCHIQDFSLKVAGRLGKKMPHLADIGLDIGITSEGFPMLIECNRRDLRYSFRDAGMDEVWRNTHITPIGYARFLLNSTN